MSEWHDNDYVRGARNREYDEDTCAVVVPPGHPRGAEGWGWELWFGGNRLAHGEAAAREDAEAACDAAAGKWAKGAGE